MRREEEKRQTTRQDLLRVGNLRCRVVSRQVSTVAITAHRPRANQIRRLVRRRKARVGPQIRAKVGRHAVPNIRAGALELRRNVGRVGDVDGKVGVADAKHHDGGLAVVVDVGGRGGVGLDLGVVVGEDLRGDAAGGRVSAGGVVFDDEASAVFDGGGFDLVEDLGVGECVSCCCWGFLSFVIWWRWR